MKPTPRDMPITLSPQEVADYCRVTRRTVYTWVLSGNLKAQKAGPVRWFVFKHDLDQFLGVVASQKERDSAKSAQIVEPEPQKVVSSAKKAVSSSPPGKKRRR